MITTWLTGEERKSFNRVDDEELNELLQEVRGLFPNLFIQSSKYEFYTGRLWWRRKESITHYTLYSAIDAVNCQIINFPMDHKWSINTGVTKSYIMTYFFGLLNGYNKNGN